MSTRFMTVLFSATENGDAELTNQVHEDIQKAKENGSFEDDEMAYEDLGEDGVLALDKGNGECTLIHNNPIAVGDDVMIDLSEVPDYCIEDKSHPEVTEDGSFVFNPSEHEFSVTTDNTAVQKIFSDQDLVETVSESVYRSEQDAQVGDLKFEKDSDTDGVIVTDLSSGDKAKVELEGENMKVTELDQKNFKTYSNKSNNMKVVRRKVFSHAEEQYEPMFVVGIDSINKVLVNSPVYSEEQANDLVERLVERGIEGVQVFVNPDEGRDYALALLQGCGAEEIADEEEMELAESEFSVIGNRYFSDRTRFMNRLFSEAEENVADHQELVESAIEDGDQLETEDFIITPVDEATAVVEDKANGEFTVAELDGEDINVDEISEDEANEMMANIEVEADEEPAEEEEAAEEVEEVKEFSNVKKVLGKINPLKAVRGLRNKVIEKGEAMGKEAMELAKKGKHKGEAALKASRHKVNPENAENKRQAVKKLAEESKALLSKADSKMKAGNAVVNNANAITAGIIGTGAAATVGAGVGAKKGYEAIKEQGRKEALAEKDYSSEDATLAQIEDSSIEAIQNVQEAAETAIAAIEQAKEAPVENVDDIKEATYSDKAFSETEFSKLYNPSLDQLI